jgi:dTDP-4-amino-4,6-dideoxygalactose transaminase
MPKFGKAEIRNLTKVIESGVFCDKRGGFLDEFREDFARDLKAKHAITGATAMLLMHVLPGVIDAGAGDEIICDPVVQFHGIACLHSNVVPVWADVRPDNFLMDPESVEKKITRRTKAIWVTHLWGFPAEVDRLREIADRHGIYLLEDCAHSLLTKYKGKFVGTWGHVGTFSFHMVKHLPTGEGGMAITNDDKLAEEISKRIIFGESPEVLSSNYRMTEFQAAVGVEQLKKIPGYLKTYRAGRKLLDEVVAGCPWLDARAELPRSEVSPYSWSCIFHGERKGIDLGVFKAAMVQAGKGAFSTGFTQRPAYLYSLFRNPEKFGKKGWPFGYKGTIRNQEGLCPVAEDVIPRLVSTNNMNSVAECRQKASLLKKTIALAESGNVEPRSYSEVEKAVLELVKARGPMAPWEVIEVFDKKRMWHFDEHGMFALMEGLRDCFPYRLSRAGPLKFSYHDLS